MKVDVGSVIVVADSGGDVHNMEVVEFLDVAITGEVHRVRVRD